MSEEVIEEGTGLSVDKKPEIVEPRLYKVLLHNDNYTTMDFVIFVLESVFRKSSKEAQTIMLNIHLAGKDVCGCYTFEIAETKIAIVDSLARNEGFPLKCSIEES